MHRFRRRLSEAHGTMNEAFDLQKVKDHSMAPRRRRHQFPTEPTAVLDDLSIDDEIVRLQERLNELERLKQSMAAPPAATSDPGLSLFPWQRDALGVSDFRCNWPLASFSCPRG